MNARTLSLLFFCVFLDYAGGVAEVVALYEKYLHTRPDLLAAIKPELQGHVLGCWCVERPGDLCHGVILAQLADGPEDVITKLIQAAPKAGPAPPVSKVSIHSNGANRGRYSHDHKKW
jgi:hypothetical protein